MSRLLVISNINSYSISANGIYFYLIYYKLLLYRNKPKFRILNSHFYIECQFYLYVLANFSLAKKVVITYTFLVVFILKLRLFGVLNLIVYTCIKGYIILFPQNLALLLNSLFSPNLVLYNIICIV